MVINSNSTKWYFCSQWSGYSGYQDSNHSPSLLTALPCCSCNWRHFVLFLLLIYWVILLIFFFFFSAAVWPEVAQPVWPRGEDECGIHTRHKTDQRLLGHVQQTSERQSWHNVRQLTIITVIIKVFIKHRILPGKTCSKHKHARRCLYTQVHYTQFTNNRNW